jgi:hypothetical protein
MHLYGELLGRYAARDLPSHTLAALDTHVSNCLFCAHALADEGSVSTRWERRGWLGRLTRAENEVVADASDEEQRARAA